MFRKIYQIRHDDGMIEYLVDDEEGRPVAAFHEKMIDEYLLALRLDGSDYSMITLDYIEYNLALEK
jgi:hypothetical protein